MSTPPTAASTGPFRGLAAFSDSDADALFFFGRGRDVKTIVANLFASRLTVLYGPSGVGKTSVLGAGVVRHVREAAPDALIVSQRAWSDDPLDALVRAVPGLQTRPGRSLADALTELTDDRGSEVYLVLDQFEEVFLHPRASVLVNALAQVVTRPKLRTHVLLALREDTLSELDVFTGLIPNVFGNYLALDRLNREMARSAITGPVARMAELEPEHAVEIEGDLVEAVLDETGVGRVALGGVALGTSTVDDDAIEAPYLQLVMERLWEAERERGSHVLRWSTLDELGGAPEIVRAHLDLALEALEPNEQDVASRMFHHLVTPSGTKIAHRVVDLAEYAGVSAEDARSVLAELAPRRIVRPIDGSVELFHDVLADAVLAWRTQHDAERALEQERTATRGRHRRLVAAVAVCLLAVVAMAALTVYALSQRTTARGEARQARAKGLDAAASTLIPSPVHLDPELSLLLAVRAARLSPHPPADDVLRRALLVSFLRRVLSERRVVAAGFGPSGNRIAVGTADGIAKVYPLHLRKPLTAVHVGAPVSTVALSRNERLLLTVSPGRPAVIWNVATGQSTVSLGSTPTQASFSPDSRLVLTVEGRRVRVWRTSDGSAVSVLRQPRRVALAAFAPRNDRIVTSAGQSVRVFSSSGGRALVVVDHGARVTSVALTPDGRLLLTAGTDGVVRIWAIRDGRLVRALRGHRSGVTGLALAPNGKLLVSTSTDGSGRVWWVEGGRFVTDLGGHTNHVTGAAFNSSGSRVVTWSTDGTARVWNPERGTAHAILAAPGDAVESASFGRGGLVLTTSADGRARLWEPPAEPQLRLLARVSPPVSAAAFSRDGRVGALAARSNVFVFDSVGNQIARFSARSAQAVAVDDSGAHVAFATGHRTVVREIAGGRIDSEFTDDTTPSALALSPDGRLLAVGTVGGAIQLRRLLETGSTTLATAGEAVTSLAFSPTGDRIAAGLGKGFLAAWEVANGKLLYRRPAHHLGTPVLGVAFSTTGRRLVTTGQDTEVRMWVAANGHPIADLHGHFALVSGAAFSPNGRWIVSAGPGTAGLWDAANRERLLFLDGHRGRLLAATFDATGLRIETAGADGTLRSYACDICGGIRELIRLATRRLRATGRSLTPTETRLFGAG